MKKLLLVLSMLTIASCAVTEQKKTIEEKPSEIVMNGDLFKSYEISHEGVKIATINLEEKSLCKENGLSGVKNKSKCMSLVKINIKNEKSVPSECSIVTNSRVILLEKEVIFKYNRDLILKDNEKMTDITVTCI
jgi:hypothetical protein